MAELEPFPRAALAANRAGVLTPEQRAGLGVDHEVSRRTGNRVGLALLAFGALLLFGAVSGRIAGRLGPAVLGVALVCFGGWLLLRGGATRTVRASGEAAVGRLGVEVVTGDIRRQTLNRSLGDELIGVSPSYQGDGRDEFVLWVGQRRLSVDRAQYDAAPHEGTVAAYVLIGTSRLVNLERLGDSAAAAAATARAAELGVHAAGPPRSAVAGPVESAALVGRWVNERLHGLAFELRADGTLVGPDGEGRWWMSGPDRVNLDGEELRVSLAGPVLYLHGEDGPALELRRG